jgi:hypothetical protein
MAHAADILHVDCGESGVKLDSVASCTSIPPDPIRIEAAGDASCITSLPSPAFFARHRRARQMPNSTSPLPARRMRSSGS